MEFNYNYDNVDASVIEKIKRRCLENNHEVIFVSHLSYHPDDNYLYIVLAKSLNPIALSKNYTVWEYNTGSSLYWGHYCLNFKEALEVFAEKVYFVED